MSIYEESGLHITVPRDSFRIQDLSSYKELCGKHLKEMDFCWLDNDNGNLYLMEVKDYSNLYGKEGLPYYLLDELKEKTIDSLLLLFSVWLESRKGREIANEIPDTIRKFKISQHNLKIIHIIKIERDKKDIIQALHTLKYRLNQLLSGRLALFNIRSVILIDHNTAADRGLPIMDVVKDS